MTMSISLLRTPTKPGQVLTPSPPNPAVTLDLGHPADPRDSTHARQGNGLLYNAASPPPVVGAVNVQVAVKPCAAGLAIAKDGKTLVVANYFDDSISIFKGGLGNMRRVQPSSSQPDFDLRLGKSGGWSPARPVANIRSGLKSRVKGQMPKPMCPVYATARLLSLASAIYRR